MASSRKTFHLFIYQGNTYIGNTTAEKDPNLENKIQIDSPVKVNFTYENASETAAKLTWLLVPVMPNVLIKATGGTKAKNSMLFEPDLIVFSNTINNGDTLDDDLITAYKNLTDEVEDPATPAPVNT